MIDSPKPGRGRPVANAFFENEFLISPLSDASFSAPAARRDWARYNAILRQFPAMQECLRTDEARLRSFLSENGQLESDNDLSAMDQGGNPFF